MNLKSENGYFILIHLQRLRLNWGNGVQGAKQFDLAIR